MFICSSCKQVSESREPQRKLVTQKRKVTYPNGSEGWEIVKEEALCSECFERNPLVDMRIRQSVNVS